MIEVRAAVPSDVERIIGLIRSDPQLPQWSREALSLGGGDMWPGIRRWKLVAESDGAFAGFAQIAAVDAEFELETMVVDAARRRLGIGRRLVETAVLLASDAGAEVFRLEVRAGNVPAIGLYEWAGFTAAGTRRGYYRDPLEDAIVMERRFVPPVETRCAKYPVS